MNDLVAAVRKLRAHLGDSQQAFATRLSLSISAIANYERDRNPTGRPLLQFMELAYKSDRPDLAEIFRAAAAAELGYPVLRVRESKWHFPSEDHPEAFQILPHERETFEAVATILRSPGLKEDQAELAKAIGPARERNAENHARATVNLSLAVEIQKKVDAGATFEEIVASFPESRREIVRMQAANALAMRQVRQERNPK